MEIRSITAPNPGPLTLEGTRTWLLGTTAVIDPGPAIDSHLDAIRAAMPRLETILITHRHADHAPAAVPLSQMTGAVIMAPRDVLEDSVVTRRVSGGESITIEQTRIDVIATPGHTSEHVCYFSADGDLFTGDTILGAGTTAIFPPDGDMGDYIRSLRRLRELQPRRILPAHGPIREDALALIDEYIEHRLSREQQVLDALRAGAVSLADIRSLVYPDLDRRLEKAAEVQITAHLIKLRREGKLPQSL